MSHESMAPVLDMDRSEAEALIMERKKEAAERATSVGDMSDHFKHEVQDLLSDNSEGVIENVADQHLAEMDRAAKGKENIALMQTEPGHLGQNRIGGGDGSMELSAHLYAELDGTEEGIETIDLTEAHESAHGRQVDAPIEWLEGHAEISANESLGKGKDHHRAGQPQELYKTGQDTVSEAIDVLDRSTVEEGMTRDFNVIIQRLMESEDKRAEKILTDMAA